MASAASVRFYAKRVGDSRGGLQRWVVMDRKTGMATTSAMGPADAKSEAERLNSTNGSALSEDQWDEIILDEELTQENPMARRKNPAKTYQPGELVRETANFLRSTGRVSTSRIDGVVVGAGSIGPYVVWSDDDIPVQINAANIEKKKTSMLPGQALSAARLATGLPIGKFSAEGYKIYVRNRERWELAAVVGTADWEKQAVRMHDELNRDVVVLSPDDSYVVLSMRTWQRNAAANPPACEMNAAARVVSKCARWLGDDANEARGLAAAWKKGMLSDKEAKRLQKIFERLAKSNEPVIQRCIEEELLQVAVGNPKQANPDGRARTLARRLSQGG